VTDVDVSVWAAELDRLHARIAGRFTVRSRAAGPGSTCPGWSQVWTASMGGPWRSRPAMCHPTGCNGCCGGPIRPLGRRCPAVLGNGRPDRELPDRRVPGLPLRERARADHRQLYLPQAWTDDRDRCRAAGIPDEVEFATKPQIARAMLERAFTAGIPFGWVTGDEAYGQVAASAPARSPTTSATDPAAAPSCGWP
jgi:DDE superfamily endonuclease